MLNIIDVVHGDKFAGMCEFAILDGMEPQPIPKGSKLVFCKQDRVDRFFPYIKEYGEKLILVTHNADTNINANFMAKNKLPENVIHWFAQNVLVSDNRITAIPIGLERPGVGKSSDYAAIFAAREKRKKNKPQKRFLLAINPNTNAALRVPLVSQLMKCTNVTVVNNLSFKDYLNEIANHAFVISPPGNGYDCHRTWEALYVGANPVVLLYDAVNMPFFNGIPMLRLLVPLVESYIYAVQSNVTECVLNDDEPMLRFDYWKNCIFKKVREIA